MRVKSAGLIFLSASSLLLAATQLSAAQSPPGYAQQGWTERDRNFWYSAPQGSRLMPLAWLRALERAGDRQPFLSPENIARYGYIPYTTPTGAALPVGFAEDRQSDDGFVRTRLRWLPRQGSTEPWVGFTCSACHTTEIAQNGRRLRIDGAPGLGYFQLFSEELDAALVATRNDTDGKWGRFAAAVLGAANRPENQPALRQAVDEQIRLRAQVAAMNGTPLRDGFARVDAFGHIFNQASLFSGGSPPSPPNLSNAPVSYPFLWNVPQHDVVQWNGSASNTRVFRLFDVGAVGRNAGEVIGVFGEVITRPPALLPKLQGFPSSVNTLNLVRLEQLLGRLQPPAWPEALLGPIDPARVARGARVFHDHCAACHVPLGRTDLTTPIVADMNYLQPNSPNRPGGWPNVPPGTDPLMACNAFFYTARTGNLQGFNAADGARIQASARIFDMLFATVSHALIAKMKDILLAEIQYPQNPLAKVTPPAPLRPPPSTVPADPFPNLPASYRSCLAQPWSKQAGVPAYKARPLTGIWATAPYLHNGSVPNLYQLLLPAARRMPFFYLGTREYDPVNLGFRTEQSPENWFEFRTRDAQGNVIWGNFNGGHDYDNASLDSPNDQVRLDLLEYLKSL